MKDLMKKEKHDHKLTNILKFVIFAIVMLAPFIAILSKIFYVAANKNAKDSYYGETINEVIRENIDYTELKTENEYYFSNELIIYNTETANNTFYISNLENITGMPSNINPSNITSFVIRTASNYQTYIQYYDNSTLVGNNNLTTTIINIKFKLNNLTINNSMEHYNYFYYNTYNKNSYLDNAFYYAIDQSKDSEILKWTKDTPIYNVINTMNNGFGLSSNHILTYLLTYWSTMIAIYIIFDIVIFALTKLTHWLQ